MTAKLKTGDVIVSRELPRGEWLVEDASWGGGCGGHDPYPDGWQLSLRKVKGTSLKNKVRIRYQKGKGGAFVDSVVLGEFKVVRRMQKVCRWKEVEDD
jgi:hypothetical protein